PESGEHETIAEIQVRGERLQLWKQRTLANEKEAGTRPLAHDPCSRLDEETVALRFVQPRDRPHGEVVGCDAEILPRARDLGRTPLAGELVEWRAEIDHFDLGSRDLPSLRHELSRTSRNRQGDVRVRFERAIRDFLKPWRLGEVGVLVKDRGNSPERGRHP